MGTIRIAGTWRIAAPPGAVWEVVADLHTWPRWWPAISDVRAVSSDAAALTFDTPAPLRPLVVELTVVDRTPPTHLSARATDGPLRGDATLELEEHDDHTAVVFDIALRVRSLLFRPLESVLAGATRSGGKQRLRQAGDDLATLAGGEPLEHDV